MATATHKKTSAGIKGKPKGAARHSWITRAENGAGKKKSRGKDEMLDQINKRLARTRQKRHKAAEANGVKLFGKPTYNRQMVELRLCQDSIPFHCGIFW